MKIKNLNIGKNIIKGFYVDNYNNRKLGRVGQEYDRNTQLPDYLEEGSVLSIMGEGNEEENKWLDEAILEVKNEKVRQFLENHREALDIYSGENRKPLVYLNKVRINPNTSDAETIYFGKESELYQKAKKERKELNEKFGQYYDFEKRIDEVINNNYNRYVLSLVGQTLSNKRDIQYLKNKKGRSEKEDIWLHNLEIHNQYSCSSLIKALKKRGLIMEERSFWDEVSRNYKKEERINWNKEAREKNEKIFLDFIKTSSRGEFYEAMKIKDSDVISMALKLRFASKYKKLLVGEGFHTFFKKDENDKETFLIFKRDKALDLCNQIEYIADEVIGEDKNKIFIDNPNLSQIVFDDEDYGECNYTTRDKSINITRGYLEAQKNYISSKNISTNAKEKYFVSSFIHEVGHSFSASVYENSKALKSYKEFAELLGFKENWDFTLYGESLKNIKKNEVRGSLNNIFIEKDNQKELDNLFKDKYEEALVNYLKETGEKESFITLPYNENVSDRFFISNYSNKSAQEGFAEYFSFYISNKKEIDKAIKRYNQNKEEFLKTFDFSSLGKFTPEVIDHSYLNKKVFIDKKHFSDRYEYDKKAREDFYKTIVERNLLLLKKVKNVIEETKI